jgi:hypothetical protein
MNQKYTFTLLLLPFAILSLLASFLFVQRAGISYKTTLAYGDLELLPQANVEVAHFFADKPVEALLLYDPQDPNSELLMENLPAALESMRISYDGYDIHSGRPVDFSQYQTVIVAFVALDDLQPQIMELVDWVEAGGRVLFAIRPLPSHTFTAIYRKLGIISKSDSLTSFNGVEYKTNLLPGGQGLSVTASTLNQTSYPVELSQDSLVHLVSADANKIPLLWEYNLGKGRFVFINSDLFIGKEGRGIVAAAYSLLQDIVVYPVINASVFFIDDFPSPAPAGTNKLIEEAYGMTIQDFYTNVWWPDMLNLSKKYTIKYTAVMIETYDYNFTAPFEKSLDSERHRYFGGQVLVNGGELGQHGYNHVPLCLTETGVNQTHDYPGWPTTESMQLSVYEWLRFEGSLFADNVVTTYVPPSNMLCSDSRLWLPALLPDLKVIASVYLNDAELTSYAQEFREASDGIIELPRIVSGYEVDNVARYEATNELALHYINSHFIHPDDVLDPERSAGHDWAYLRDRYEEYIQWVGESAPALRNMTAREAAIAVQRYARLAVKTKTVDNNFQIDLGNFYDEAWLMLRTKVEPKSIEGGTITPITSDLYLIRALKPKVILNFQGAGQ